MELKNTIDAEVMQKFYKNIEAMQAGNGVLFHYNLLKELVDVPVIDKDTEEEGGLDAMVEEQVKSGYWMERRIGWKSKLDGKQKPEKQNWTEKQNWMEERNQMKKQN